VHQPSLLLADEPTGTRLRGREGGVDMISGCIARRVTVLLATHSDEAARRAGRTVRLRDGDRLNLIFRG
jgi:ABC-type lipoprotein export system ATPase subunit